MDLKKIMAEMLTSLKKNEIIISTEFNNNSELVDKSKIGGKPYLPKDFVWPYYQELPLSFLAQINLEEVNSFDKDKLLPSTGMLYFFYELETEEWGYHPESKGCAKVFYFEDTSNFELINFPKDMKDYCEVPEFKVSFKSNISLPSYENFYLILKEQDTFKKQDISFKDFIPLYDEIFIPDTNYTKLLGHPEVIQNPMEEECEAVTRGFNMGGIESYPKQYQKEIRVLVKIGYCFFKWILLNLMIMN